MGPNSDQVEQQKTPRTDRFSKAINWCRLKWLKFVGFWFAIKSFLRRSRGVQVPNEDHWKKEHDKLQEKYNRALRNIASWWGRLVFAFLALLLTAKLVYPIVENVAKSIGEANALSVEQFIAAAILAVVWVVLILGSFWYTRTLR